MTPAKPPKPKEVFQVVDLGYEDPRIIEFTDFKARPGIRVSPTYSVSSIIAKRGEITWTPRMVPGDDDLAYGKGGFIVPMTHVSEFLNAFLDVYNKREGTSLQVIDMGEDDE